MRFTTTLYLLCFAWLVALGQANMELPLTAEDAIILQELEWAEKAMEGYKQKRGVIPLRSSIRAAHVHTEDWRRDSVELFTQGSKDDAVNGKLRGTKQ